MQRPTLSPPGSPGSLRGRSPGPGIGGGGMIGGAKPFSVTPPHLPKPAPLGVSFAGQMAPGAQSPLGMAQGKSPSAGSYVERASINLVEVVQRRLDVLRAEKLRLQLNTKDPRATDRIRMVEAEMTSITEDPEYVSALGRLETAAGQRAAVSRRKQLLEVLRSGQQHLREVEQQVQAAESRQNITSGPLIHGAIADVQGKISEQNQFLVRLRHHAEAMEVALAHVNHRLMGHERTNMPRAEGLQEAQLRLKDEIAENAKLRQRVVTVQDELSEAQASKKQVEGDYDRQVEQLKQSTHEALEQQAVLRRRLAELSNEKELYIKESSKAVGTMDKKYRKLFGDIEDLEVQVGLRAPPEEMSDAEKTHSTGQNYPMTPVTNNPYRGAFD